MKKKILTAIVVTMGLIRGGISTSQAQQTAELVMDDVFTVGGPGNDEAAAVYVDEEGTGYVGGVFENTVDFDPGTGSDQITAEQEDGFVSGYIGDSSPLEQNGYEETWRFGGAGYDDLSDVAADSDGGYDGEGRVYVVGAFEGTVDFNPGSGEDLRSSRGEDDAFLSVFDGAGTYLYTYTAGGPGNDEALAVSVDADGNVALVGSFEDTVDFDPSAYAEEHTSHAGTDVFVTQFDPDGNYVRTHTFGGSGEYDEAEAIAHDSQGNLYLAGSFQNTVDFDPTVGVDEKTASHWSDIFITKLNSDGTYGWTAVMGGLGDEGVDDIAVDDADNVVVVGDFEETVDFDPSAATDERAADGREDLFVTKLSGDGTYQWTYTAGGTEEDAASAVVCTDEGQIVVAGVFRDTVDFNPADGVTDQHSSNGEDDIFLTVLEADGSYGGTQTIGGPGYDDAEDLATSNNGELFMVGAYEGTVDFDPGADVDEHTSNGEDDVFVARFDFGLTSGITEMEIGRGDDTEYPGEGDEGYEYWVEVGGDGLTDLEVTTPWGESFIASNYLPADWSGDYYEEEFAGLGIELEAYTEDGTRWIEAEWEISESEFNTLDSGNSDVTVTYSGGSWTGTVDFTSSPMPTQVPAITYPSHGQTGVELQPTFTWEQWTSPDDTANPGVWWELTERNNWEEGYEEDHAASDTTSWTPMNELKPGTEYEFDVGFHHAPTVTVNGVDVQMISYLESDVDFTTEEGPAYDVWGGETDYNDEPEHWNYYYNIDQQDYTLLGSADGTATFTGDYSYYVIGANQEVLVDAVEGSDGTYYQGGFTTGNTGEPGNLRGAPDNQYATVGCQDSGASYRGFVRITNPGNWDALTVWSGAFPDLLISAPTTQTLKSAPGEEVEVSVTVENIGDADAFVPDEPQREWDTTLYLSDDDQFDEDTDTEVAEFALTELAAGASETQTLTFNAPGDPGTYYLAAKTDDFDVVPESDETNNWSAVVTLQVQTMDADDDGLSDSWEQQIVDADTDDDINSIADVLPEDDFDDDGVSNRDEYDAGTNPVQRDSDGDGYLDGAEINAGTNPTNAASLFRVTAQPTAGSPSQHIILNWQAVTGRVYNVLWTPTLMEPFQPLEIGIQYPQNSYTDTVHAIESSGYYRVMVMRADYDVDGDGLPNEWESQYEVADAFVDGDSDGFDNLAEFIAGTDPTNGASFFKTASSIAEVNGTNCFVVEWISIPDRLYSVQWSTNIISGFQTLEAGIEHPQNSYTDTVHSTESQGYYKVDVQLDQ